MNKNPRPFRASHWGSFTRQDRMYIFFFKKPGDKFNNLLALNEMLHKPFKVKTIKGITSEKKLFFIEKRRKGSITIAFSFHHFAVTYSAIKLHWSVLLSVLFSKLLKRKRETRRERFNCGTVCCHRPWKKKFNLKNLFKISIFFDFFPFCGRCTATVPIFCLMIDDNWISSVNSYYNEACSNIIDYYLLVSQVLLVIRTIVIGNFFIQEWFNKWHCTRLALPAFPPGPCVLTIMAKIRHNFHKVKNTQINFSIVFSTFFKLIFSHSLVEWQWKSLFYRY